MTYTDKQADRAVEYAEQLGQEHGTNAAAWWHQDALGGRSTASDAQRRETARTILAGLEDCDPAIYDALPEPDLSGQWADSYSSRDLMRDALDEANIHEEDGPHENMYDLEGAICDAYEDGFRAALEDAVSAYCRSELEVTP